MTSGAIYIGVPLISLTSSSPNMILDTPKSHILMVVRSAFKSMLSSLISRCNTSFAWQARAPYKTYLKMTFASVSVNLVFYYTKCNKSPPPQNSSTICKYRLDSNTSKILTILGCRTYIRILISWSMRALRWALAASLILSTSLIATSLPVSLWVARTTWPNAPFPIIWVML